MPAAVRLYDNATLHRLEAAANATHGDAFTLMQRAGQSAWRCLLSRWPRAQRIVVACGPGNNGGDGYVLAYHALRSGRDVSVVRIGAPDHEPALRACRQYEAAGGRCVAHADGLPGADLVVDAVFGIGLSRAPEGALATLIDSIDAHTAQVFALDVPSGVDAERGSVPGVAVRATATLQFVAAHPGLSTGPALDYRGRLEVASLGVELDAAEACAIALHPDDLGTWLRPRARDSHKGSNGYVLCIGGDHGHGGAIAMTADAALRSGAGLVAVATRAGHVPALLARRPEAMVSGVERGEDLRALLRQASVVAIGPGLGLHAWGQSLWEATIDDGGKPLVVDADGLNHLASHPRKLPPGTILTPHPGEAARLLGVQVRAVQADRFAAARTLAAQHACVVVLKGAGTIIAAPDRIPCVIDAGNPGMAVGGMGDLLTGVIAALRAQSLEPFDAACCGALLHAAAGDAAAREGGERGLLPSDLLAHLRRLSNPAPER